MSLILRLIILVMVALTLGLVAPWMSGWINLSEATGIIVVGLIMVVGLPFVVPALYSLPLVQRVEISAIFGGGAIALITALFLVGEYEDRTQARITRAWQLLYQAQDRAAVVVCEAQRNLTHDGDCSRPAPIPSFVGTHVLVCAALIEAQLLDEQTGCAVHEIEGLRGDPAFCEALLANGLVDECNGPPGIYRIGGAWPANLAIREAMHSQFGHYTAVQTLFDARLPTQGLHLRWFNLENIIAATGQDLRGANLSGANLRGAALPDAVLGVDDLAGTADLSGAYLHDAKLTGARMRRVNLSNSRGTRVDMSKADLRCADLRYAVLLDAELEGTDLRAAELFEARLGGSDLTGAKLREADVTGASLSGVRGLTQVQLNMACAYWDNPPNLMATWDAETGRPLVWQGRLCEARRVCPAWPR